MSSRETETLDLRHVGEVAAVIAKSAPAILASSNCLTQSSLQTYWQACRQRSDLWQFTLESAIDASKRDQPLGSHTVRSVTSIIAEVLSTELISRLWTAVIVGHERRHNSQNEILGRRVYADHLTARRSCLKLLTHPIALPSSEIVTLNRIRQRAERWTDCLLATLPIDCEAVEFAFDSDRYAEFLEDSDVMTKISPHFDGWHLLALSLRVADAKGPETNRARNSLHREILNSIGSVIECATSRSLPPIPSDQAGEEDLLEAIEQDESVAGTAADHYDAETESERRNDEAGDVPLKLADDSNNVVEVDEPIASEEVDEPIASEQEPDSFDDAPQLEEPPAEVRATSPESPTGIDDILSSNFGPKSPPVDTPESTDIPALPSDMKQSGLIGDVAHAINEKTRFDGPRLPLPRLFDGRLVVREETSRDESGSAFSGANFDDSDFDDSVDVDCETTPLLHDRRIKVTEAGLVFRTLLKRNR